MPLLIVGDEENFAALRSRLFERRVSNAIAKRVADALKAANPHADLDNLRPGVVLTVPELPEIAIADLSLDDTVDRAVETLRADLAAAIEALQRSAAERAREAAAERKRILPLFDAEEVRAAAGRDDALAADLAAAQEAIEADAAAAKVRTTELKKAVEEWAAELDALNAIRPHR
jgi:hypothetical protein